MLCRLFAKSGAGCWNRTSLVSLKRRVHQPALPITHVQHQSVAGCWNRTNTSRLSTAGSTFELILLWCAVRELNPHLFGVGQLFWSVELPARKIGRGYRSRTCLAALIWRRSGYKPLLLPEAPPLVARDGFEPSATAL